MNGRPKKMRRMGGCPTISGMRPYGSKTRGQKNEAIFLHYDEYESLRLSDYEGMNQSSAAEVMGVSRPTFTRIYGRARQKIAQSLIEGKVLRIEGGKVHYDNSWYLCSECGSTFNDPSGEGQLERCPLCASVHFSICQQNEF